MKKVLVSLIATCLLFSGFVTVKSLTRNNPILNAPVEALSETESNDPSAYPYQSMGFCPGKPWTLTLVCVSNPLPDPCTNPCD